MALTLHPSGDPVKDLTRPAGSSNVGDVTTNRLTTIQRLIAKAECPSVGSIESEAFYTKALELADPTKWTDADIATCVRLNPDCWAEFVREAYA